jgi:hypothetical protein
VGGRGGRGGGEGSVVLGGSVASSPFKRAEGGEGVVVQEAHDALDFGWVRAKRRG